MRDRILKPLPMLLLGAVLVRVAAAFYLGDSVTSLPGTADQVSYHTLALRVLAGHGLTFGKNWWPATAAGEPTAHWSYLYTFYLAAVYRLFGAQPLLARLIQAVLVGLLQPYLAFVLGRRVFDHTVGLVSAGLTGFYAYFVYYSATLMTEPFYITAVLASIYLAIRLSDRGESGRMSLAIPLGLVLAAAVLLRQLFMLVIPFLLLWMWWRVRRRARAEESEQVEKSILPAFLVVIAILGAAILPFTAFNYQRFDRFVLLNTNAGYAFFWANHPIYGTHFEPILPPEMGTYQDLIPDELRSLDEAALDQELLTRGVQFVWEDPARYLLLSLSRIPAYFTFWPSSESGTISNVARVFSFGLLWPFMLYGLILAFLPGQPGRAGPILTSPGFLLVLFAGLYTVIHVLSWTLIRYRLPVDAVLLVFAGFALFDLGRRALRWLRRSGAMPGRDMKGQGERLA